MQQDSPSSQEWQQQRHSHTSPFHGLQPVSSLNHNLLIIFFSQDTTCAQLNPVIDAVMVLNSLHCFIQFFGISLSMNKRFAAKFTWDSSQYASLPHYRCQTQRHTLTSPAFSWEPPPLTVQNRSSPRWNRHRNRFRPRIYFCLT